MNTRYQPASRPLRTFFAVVAVAITVTVGVSLDALVGHYGAIAAIAVVADASADA